MLLGLSSHLVFPERLTPGRLEALQRAGAGAIEVFCSRHHFDYTDRGSLRELGNWFRSNPVQLTLHMPLFSPEDESQWSRHTAPSLNLVSRNKGARFDAVDEVKRALETAEQAPVKAMTLHLGLKDDEWSTETLDLALTAIEPLLAFAAPMGVTLLLENLLNDLATPAHLVEITRVGHFDRVGFCLDVGHAHLIPAIPETRHEPAKTGLQQAFEAFATVPGRLHELHLHDNPGLEHGHGKDSHLWPGAGTIDWKALGEQVRSLPTEPLGMLEIGYDLGTPEAQWYDGVAKSRDLLGV